MISLKKFAVLIALITAAWINTAKNIFTAGIRKLSGFL